jgi:hypothetical protein
VHRSELLKFDKLRRLIAKVFHEEHQKSSKEDAEGLGPLETKKLKRLGNIEFPEHR